MNILKNYITIILLGLMLSFSKESNGQCSNPAWISTYPYSAGDVVSNGGSDWTAGGSANQYFWEPSSGAGSFGWTILNVTCAGPSTPFVDATLVRANYCTTSFGIGRISSSGDATITRRGFVYGETSLPNVENDLVLVDASTSVGDEFEGLMENLTPETDYYVRTFAENSEGRTYGTQASFTTRATSDCVTGCDLACDMTTPGLYNPTVSELENTYKIISADDTICITEDRNYNTASIINGMLKVCNGAVLTISGSMQVNTSEVVPGNLLGQIVYEGCNEKIDGTGNYRGSEIFSSLGLADPKQMISYCGTCNDNDTAQFVDLDNNNVPALWGATCRPTSTLIVPLPVELISFSANIHEEGVLLEWSTGAEINNSHFEIELSYDGVNWFKIGLVEGSGNSTQNIDYKFLDNSTSEGLQYYRLKQVDFDNSFQYSTVKHVSFDKENDKPTSFIAFQNQNNQVEVQAKFNGMGEAYLIDTRGRIVETQTFVSTNKNGTKLTFQNTSLANGVYFVKIKSGNALLGQKVQILK